MDVMEQKIAKYIEDIQSFLYSYQNKDGGWPYLVKGKSFTEPTALSIFFLSLMEENNKKIKEGIKWLLQTQNKDGGWPNMKNGPSDIRTAHVIYALSNFTEFDDEIYRGIRWLKFNRRLTGGWAWCYGAFNFTEPTSYAVLALHKTEALANKKELLDFIFSYQCEDGGWNSHCPIMLDVKQKGQISVTPWPLLALKKLGVELQDCRIQNAFQFIECQTKQLKEPVPYSNSLILWASVDYRKKSIAKNILHSLLKNKKQNVWRENILWTALLGISLQRYMEIF
jgi:squalene cyclase